jgi:hypothetical protein
MKNNKELKDLKAKEIDTEILKLFNKVLIYNKKTKIELTDGHIREGYYYSEVTITDTLLFGDELLKLIPFFGYIKALGYKEYRISVCISLERLIEIISF